MADVSTPPLDYTSAFNNIPSVGSSFLQGVQGGFAVQQGQLQQQMQRCWRRPKTEPLMRVMPTQN